MPKVTLSILCGFLYRGIYCSRTFYFCNPKSAIRIRLLLCLLITQGRIARGASAGIPADSTLPTAARTFNRLDVCVVFLLTEQLLQDNQKDQYAEHKAGTNQHVLHRILTEDYGIHHCPQLFKVWGTPPFLHISVFPAIS